MSKAEPSPAEPQNADQTSRDRRGARRFRCDNVAHISLPYGGLSYPGRVFNLSETGCYIETAFRLERGAQVEVTLEIHNLRLRALAGVRSVANATGLGLEFVHVSPRRRRQIQEIVAELAEQEAKFEGPDLEIDKSQTTQPSA